METTPIELIAQLIEKELFTDIIFPTPELV